VNEANYRSLCEACDEILRRSDLPKETRALSYLHIIREHPIFLTKYEPLFVEGESANTPRSPFRNALSILKLLLQITARPPQPGSEEPVDILFVSHLLNAAQLDASEDFYFYNLPEFVQSDGHSAEVLLINQTSTPLPARGLFSRGGVPTSVMARHRSLSSAMRDMKRLLQTRTALRQAASFERRPLHRKILRAASDQCLSADTLADLGIAAQVGDVVKRRRPKMLVTTSEGHAWERLSYRAATEVHPLIVCAGYQHAAVFRMQHALRRALGSGWDPQLLFASGEMARDLIQRTPDFKSIPIHVLGSRRGRAARSKPQITGIPKCLVIPEGTHEECRILFDFSRRWAELDPRLTFIWRLHPVLSPTAFFAEYLPLPPNVIVSRAALDDDIAESHAVLYRGSTAVIRAAAAGLLPIYLAQSDELSIDLLFDLSADRLVVSHVEEVRGRVDVASLPCIKRQRIEDRDLQKRLDRFYSLFDPKVFLESIPSQT